MARFTFSLPLFALLSLGCNASPTPGPVPSAEASATASAAPSAVGPRIVAVKPVHDFGKVKLGAVVEHTFKIRNEGTEPLKIAGARGSWGCTATVVTTEALPPGGEGEIKTTLKTKGRGGPLKKTVLVSSNDPDNPKLTLTLAGEIAVDIEAEPRLLSLGQVSPGETVKRELRLRVKEPGVTITDVKALDEGVSVERVSKDEHLYDVIFAGQADLGSISSKIRVEYTGGQADHVDVTVWGSVVGDLTYPRQLSFRREGDAFRPQTLRIKSRSGKTVRVLSATDPDGKVTARVTKASGTTAEIELTVAEGTTDPGRGKIHVRTNDAIEPTVEVGYYLAPKRRVGNTRVRPRGSARQLEK